MPSTLWPPSRRDAALFGGFALLLFIAWMPHLLPGSYSVDDYAQLHFEDLGWTLRQEVGQGRFGQAIIHELLARIGADPIASVTLINFAAIALLAAAAVIAVRIWDLQGLPGAALLAGALAFVHPFAAELWSFRLAPFSFAVALLPALWAVLLLRRTTSGFTLPIVLIASSLTIYQTNLNPILVVVVLGAALDLARVPSGKAEVRTVLRVWVTILGCVLLACGVYFAMAKLVQLALSIPPEARAGLLQPREVPQRLKEIASLLPRLLFKERQLGTGLLAGLQIALLALAFALALSRSLAERSARRIGWTVLLLALALLAVVGVVGVVRVFWPTARVLTAAGFFWAGVLALCAVQAERSVRAAALGLGALLLFGSAGVDHRAAADQQRVNVRDLLLMTRVLTRLEHLPGAPGVHRLFIAGAQGGYGDLKTLVGDLNRSAFGTPWSWAGLVAEAGGPWVTQSTEDDRARAASLCATAGKWPADDAVRVDGDLAIVCF